MMVVPGSGQVKKQAEEEGLDRVFKESGFDWREAGCSMPAMNPDKLSPGERCASTSNRNFEGRQGKGGRTHHQPGNGCCRCREGHLLMCVSGTQNIRMTLAVASSPSQINFISSKNRRMQSFTIHSGVVATLERAQC